jgi:hypothetical protein
MKAVLQSAIALLCVFAALNAKATPLVGDKSTFRVNLTLDDQSMNGTATFELMSYDVITDMWEQVTTTEFDGQKNVEKIKSTTHDLLNDAMIDDVLANCATKGGSPETITVPAGSFITCNVPVASDSATGTIWIAKVPFGYAQWHSLRADGVIVNGVLESFVSGTPPTSLHSASR